MESLHILLIKTQTASPLLEPLKSDFPLLVEADSFDEALEILSAAVFEIVVFASEMDEELPFGFLQDARKRSSLTQFLVLSQKLHCDIVHSEESLFFEIPSLERVRQMLELLGRTFFHKVDYARQKNRLMRSLMHDVERVMLLIEIVQLSHYYAAFSLHFVDNIIYKVGEFLEDYRPSDSDIFNISEGKYVILLDDSEMARAESFARILDALILDRKIYIKKQEVGVNFSVGIAKGSGESLLSKTYVALNVAKNTKSKFFILAEDDEKFRFYQNENIHWMRSVRSALLADRIIPYYQPIINNATGKIEKYECLARLKSDEAIVSAGTFLPSARQIGVISDVTRIIINKSLALFRNSNYGISLNITEEDIRETKIITYLLNRCEFYSIDPSRITIEISEDTMPQASHIGLGYIHHLHREGFKIAIDDFGLSNASFARLVCMRAEYIKISGNLISQIESDKDSLLVVESIAKCCRSLDVKTIAKHVHSKSVQARIMELGIDYSQGYLFGEANPEA
ncbi:MAG: EAL domain-containing protein [Wolinella sp.]